MKPAEHAAKQRRKKKKATSSDSVWSQHCIGCKHIKANLEFALRMQKGLNKVFCCAPSRFIQGEYPKVNPEWKNAEDTRQYIINGIEQLKSHMFNLDHQGCEGHDSKWEAKSGHCITCPVQQAQISQMLEDKVIKDLHRTVLDDVGLVHTNFVEALPSVIRIYRRKDFYHHADTEFTKTMFGILHYNTTALFNQGITHIWQEEICSELNAVLEHVKPSKEMLVTPSMHQYWLQHLTDRKAANKKKQSAAIRKKEAQRNKLRAVERKERTKAVTRKTRYDHKHTGELSQSSIEGVKLRRQCGSCKLVTRQHNARNCPYNESRVSRKGLESDDNDG
jgi:hypothetical protein